MASASPHFRTAAVHRAPRRYAPTAPRPSALRRIFVLPGRVALRSTSAVHGASLLPRALWRCVLAGCLAVPFGSACTPELSPPERSSVFVESEDGAPLDAISRSPRLLVRGGEAEVFVPGLRLFQGEVSSHANQKLRKGEVIQALAKREISISVWTEPDAIAVAPADLLPGGEKFTLAVLGRGALAEFVVAEEESPVLRHFWPPVLAPWGEVVYCLDGASTATLDAELFEDDAVVSFAPRGTAGEGRAGIGDEGLSARECVTFVPLEPPGEEFWLPPPRWGNALIAQGPIPVRSEDGEGVELQGQRRDARFAPEAPPCGEQEVPFVDTCGTFDGVEFRFAPEQPSAWFVRAEARDAPGTEPRDFRVFTAQGEPLVLHPFAPLTDFELLVHRYDAWGRRAHDVVRGRTGEPEARLVINEVLADPLGPEPQGEWVELVNIGAAPAWLEGWTLEDGGGATPLPAVEVPPGRYALIVAADYSATAGDDVVPLPDTIPLVVERVGHRGLTNGGEPLRLVDPEGRVVSSMPALGSGKAGFSVARREPWAPDRKESFARHAPPGASPGGPNAF